MSGWDDTATFWERPIAPDKITCRKVFKLKLSLPLDTVQVFVSGNVDAMRLAHIVQHPHDYPRDDVDDGPNHLAYMNERKVLSAKLANVPLGINQWGSWNQRLCNFDHGQHIKSATIENACLDWYRDSAVQKHVFVTTVKMASGNTFVYSGALVALHGSQKQLVWRFVRYCNAAIKS
jgi:hypothetical protein